MRVEKISYKHPQSLKESINIAFIENDQSSFLIYYLCKCQHSFLAVQPDLLPIKK